MTDDLLIENEMDDNDLCKIRIYNKRNKRAPVFMTSFSQGVLNTNADNQVKFECFKNDGNNIGCDAERKLIANNGRLNYIGSSNTPLMKHFVGVRNKTTGKIKFYDSVLFHMKPDVKNYESDIHSDTTPKTYSENLNDLTKSFGSKAKKRALNTYLKCNVDTSLDDLKCNVDTSLDESLNNSKQLTPDTSLQEDSQQHIDYFPPQNRVASRVEDVFDIDFIISPEEDASLAEEVENLLTAPLDVMMTRKLSFCVYVSEHFVYLSDTKAKYLLYYDYLIKFQKLKYSDLKRKDPAPDIPEPYKRNILSKFTLLSTSEKGRESKHIPPKMKDKLLSYILVLALFIDDFKVNINLLLKDFSNPSFKRIATIAKALGCYVSSKKIDGIEFKYAELKLPLYVSTPNYGGKKSRK